MIRCLDLVAIPYNHCAELSDFLIHVTCIKIIQHVKIIRIKLRGREINGNIIRHASFQ